MFNVQSFVQLSFPKQIMFFHFILLHCSVASSTTNRTIGKCSRKCQFAIFQPIFRNKWFVIWRYCTKHRFCAVSLVLSVMRQVREKLIMFICGNYIVSKCFISSSHFCVSICMFCFLHIMLVLCWTALVLISVCRHSNLVQNTCSWKCT